MNSGVSAASATSRRDAGEAPSHVILQRQCACGGHAPAGGVIGKRERKGLRYVARVKAGFVPATRGAVMDAIAGLRMDDCPFFNLPEAKGARWGQALTAEEMEKCRWVNPKVKVRVAFVEWTEALHLRHSRFVELMKR